MMISFNKYPVDIALCVLWSIILLHVALLDVRGIIPIIVGLPFIFFIPGYVLIFALFPIKKTDTEINNIERFVLSIGFSIAVVSLIGLGLNYTPWGIQLESFLLSIFAFIIIVGIIGTYRWFRTTPDERFVVSLDFSFISSKRNLEKAFTILIGISIIIAITTSIYVLYIPKQGEKFTEFYIIPLDQNTTNYPKNLTVEKNDNVIIGILNHEYETINYTVEIWLLNQQTNSNESENKIIINNMWFVDKISVSLKHKELEETSTTQWEYNYSISINRTGSFKLAFLLFTSPTEEYNKDMDYADIAVEKIDNAYRETHLWVNIY